ncbi:MAG: hypothetical protein ACXWQQ_02785 [Pseudobdellovibrio sp.]
MKLVLCFLFFAFSNFASANETQLGLILGSITGISGKYDLGSDRALDAALAYSLDGRYGLSLHGDYLFNKQRTFAVNEINPLNLYYGIGLRLIEYRNRDTENGNSSLGVRFPVGIYYRTNNPKLELFGELAPVLELAHSTYLDVDAGIGVRLVF